MVVLAASVLTRSGKTLVSRQFVDISRVRIEGLLAAFPKLMGTEKQHTYIETENVRYVYQPMESLYMVLITNKTSNILEDLETLLLFVRVVSEECRSFEEDIVLQHAFELIFAFDEVCSLGYREKVTVQQIKIFTEMESHQEKIHEMIEKNKEREAKELAKRRQHQIEQERAAVSRQPSGPSQSLPVSERTVESQPFMVKPKEAPAPAPVQQQETATKKKGMVLGKAKKNEELLKAIVTEDHIINEPTPSPVKDAPKVEKEAVQIAAEEKIIVVCNADGGLEQMEVKGDLSITISDANFGRVKVKVANAESQKFQYKTHPNINKNSWTGESLLALKDPSRSFPVGSSLSLLKWRYQTNNEDEVPLSVNCWPTIEGNTATVNIEYELTQPNLELRDVTITIPIPGPNLVIESADGSHRFDNRNNILEWSLPLIDSSNSTGSMEFNLNFGGASSAFFPIRVDFISENTFCPIQVESVVAVDDNHPVPFSETKGLAVEQYEIV
eukprot:TRINITY_DN6037_c0_g1_i1.p1 TRINITY_DN6037_c0_g1~~TRINITY_DN6037_c0_g1_i1.p1  ORF type:complete len:500 (-),score=141.28 TRINITY_DN6037_c0_g1_i1:167-1666(-)